MSYPYGHGPQSYGPQQMPYHYHHHTRAGRFGLFRRFWWFGIGAGVATIWLHKHHRDDSRPVAWGWGHCRMRQAVSAPPQSVPSHPAFVDSVPAVERIEQTQPAPAPTPTPAPVDAAVARQELETKAKKYADEQLERLMGALERIREGLQEEKKDGRPRWV